MIEYIGRGGYSEVHLYIHIRNDVKVAVKTVRKEPLDQKSEERIRKEVDILKSISHENISTLYDYIERPLEIFIILEYIPGDNLFHWMRIRNFSVSESTTKFVIKELARTLVYLHTLGIVHRDIKMENVIVLSDKNRISTVKLIDFGLSTWLAPGQTVTESVGTLKYAAPEVISRVPYSTSVDVWGLGVIAYVLLAGNMPFYGKNDTEVAG